MAKTQNIKPFDEQNTANARGQKLASLKTISTGFKVNKNYKPGQDKDLDATLKKLKENPSSLDSSGFGKQFKI